MVKTLKLLTFDKNTPIKNTFFASTYLLLLSYIISWVVTLQKSVDPTKPLDLTSALAFGQLVFWISIILIFLFVISLKKSFDLKKSIRFFLVNLVALATGLITGSIAVSLKNQVQYFGLLQGDLGVHLQMANNAYNSGWESSGYPPLFPTIVGNLAHVFKFNEDPVHQVTSAHKFISIYSIPVWATIIFILFRYAFPALLAEFLALVTVLGISIDAWKVMGELGTQLMILILINRLYKIYQGKEYKLLYFRVTNLAMGFIFGLFVILYFGRLWWVSLAIALAAIITNFLNKNRQLIQLAFIDYFLGSLIPLTPMLMASKYAEVKLGLRISEVLPLVFIFVVLWACMKPTWALMKFITPVFTLLFSLVVTLAIFNFEINDTFIYEGVYGNMAKFIDISSFSDYLAIALLLFIGLYGFDKNNVLSAQIIFISFSIISAAILMLYFAYQMMYTNKVELWPRAGFTIGSNIQLLIFILIYLSILNLKKVFEKVFVNRLPAQSGKIVLVIVCLLVSLYVSTSLGSTQWYVLNQ